MFRHKLHLNTFIYLGLTALVWALAFLLFSEPASALNSGQIVDVSVSSVNAGGGECTVVPITISEIIGGPTKTSSQTVCYVWTLNSTVNSYKYTVGDPAISIPYTFSMYSNNSAEIVGIIQLLPVWKILLF